MTTRKPSTLAEQIKAIQREIDVIVGSCRSPATGQIVGEESQAAHHVLCDVLTSLAAFAALDASRSTEQRWIIYDPTDETYSDGRLFWRDVKQAKVFVRKRQVEAAWQRAGREGRPNAKMIELP